MSCVNTINLLFSPQGSFFILNTFEGFCLVLAFNPLGSFSAAPSCPSTVPPQEEFWGGTRTPFRHNGL